MLDSLRFIILRSLFGSICLFVQSYSPLYSFTHKQIDLKKQPRNLAKLIYRTALKRVHKMTKRKKTDIKKNFTVVIYRTALMLTTNMNDLKCQSD